MGRKCRPVAAKGVLAALGWLVGLAGFLAVGKVSLLILTAVFAVTLTLFRRSDKLRSAVMIGVFAIVGGLYAMYYQTNIYSRLTAFDGKTAQVSGVVTDLSYSEYGTNVTVRGRLEGTRGRFTFLLPDYAGDRHDLAPAGGNAADFQLSICADIGFISSVICRSVRRRRDLASRLQG